MTSLLDQSQSEWDQRLSKKWSHFFTSDLVFWLSPQLRPNFELRWGLCLYIPRNWGSRASGDVRWTSIRRLRSSRACREPLYRSSYRFRLASWCEPFRRGANSLMDREFDVHYEHARSWRRCLSYKTNYFFYILHWFSIPRIINVAFIDVQWPITVVLNSYIWRLASYTNTHFNMRNLGQRTSFFTELASTSSSSSLSKSTSVCFSVQ